jgi:uncharacterized membrane protein YphA (DoxX/SURF4 family)
MILENFKKILSGQDSLLRILMAVIFISAGLFRIFNPIAAENELIKLGLPNFFTWFILVIEIGGGFVLLVGKYLKIVLVIFVIFLLVALGGALLSNGYNIIAQAGELFIFDATPTDFFMHFVFLVILIFLFRSKTK